MSDYCVKIHADVEREDKILANLTARQVAILASTAVVLWVIFTAVRDHVPTPAFTALAVPIGSVAAAFAMVKRDGIWLDRFVLAAVRQARSPRRMVTTTGDIPPVPDWAQAPPEPLPAPLRLPATAIAADGVITLGTGEAAVIVGCSTVSFALRTPDEQAALVGAFARYLNALSGEVQIVVRAERVNVGPAVQALRDAAPSLPCAVLEQAARDHADFLEELASTRDLLWRQVLLVIRESAAGPDDDSAPARVRRRAEEAVRHLSAAGIAVTPLDGATAMTILRSAADPSAPPSPNGLTGPGEVITGKEARA